MFNEAIFAIFPVWLLGTLSLLIAIGYFLRGNPVLKPQGFPHKYMWIFYARSINWAMVSFAFFLFPFLNILDGRALLRLAITFLILFESAYNLAYFSEFIREKIKSWMHS